MISITWFLPIVVLSMVGEFSNARSATCDSDDHCRTEQSALGKALIGFTYRTLGNRTPLECYEACEADIICQSINFYVITKQCEFNNRTKDARPGHFFEDSHRFYLKRITNPVKLGSIKELPAFSCQEIKESEGDYYLSGYYWLKPDNSSKTQPSYAYCAMPSRVGDKNTRVGKTEGYSVPSTSRYSITAYGARGGTHSYNYGYRPGTYFGGRGAKIKGIFSLSKGTVLVLVVGKRGGNSVEVKGGMRTSKTAAELGLSVEDNAGTGGGGGSFVYTVGQEKILLMAAGGGGGASGGFNGIDGQAGEDGTESNGLSPLRIKKGGKDGQPGECNTYGGNWHGGAGAGWLGSACKRRYGANGDGGGSLDRTWAGGQAGWMNSGSNGGLFPGTMGGYGGGGGGAEDNGASGGGGGYSGGGSGTGSRQAGGGGGSYCGGESCIAITGGNMFDYGMITIEEILE